MSPRRKGVRVDVDTFAAETFFKRLKANIVDLSDFFRGPLDRSVTDFFQAQFETEGAHGGTPWAPLAPLSHAMRDRAGQGRGGIGRDSSGLWAAFTKGSGPGAIRNVGPQSYERGSDLPHAQWFHGGWKITVFGQDTDRTAPARPIIPDPLPSFLVEEWAALLADHL